MSVRRRAVQARVERDRTRAAQLEETTRSLNQLRADLDDAIAGRPPEWLRQLQADNLERRLQALARWRHNPRAIGQSVVPPEVQYRRSRSLAPS